MTSHEPTSVSIGKLFEALQEIRRESLKISMKTTEPMEKELAGQMVDLSDTVADVLVLLREHLSGHDAKVIDHTHSLIGEYRAKTDRVFGVFAGEIVEEPGG